VKKIIIAILGVLLIWILAYPSTLVKVMVPKANVRSQPSLQSQVIAQLSQGMVVEALEKAGDWYHINLPADDQGIIRSGYIHKNIVEEVSGVAQKQEATPVKVKPARVQQAPSSGNDLFSGFAIKGGLMFSPEAGGFADRWLLSFGYDFPISSFLSFGFEVQPAFRSYPDLDLFILPIMAFANVQLGSDLGVLWNKLRFLGIYGGCGPGLESSFSMIEAGGETVTDFAVRFAFHFFTGLEFDLIGINPFIEYQAIQVSYPELEENFFLHFLMIGLRF